MFAFPRKLCNDYLNGLVRIIIFIWKIQQSITENLSKLSKFYFAAFAEGVWHILEPIMNVEITVPSEFSGLTLVDINKRNGVLKFQEARDEYTTFVCEVGLPK